MPVKNKQNRNIALVLSSGGARGIAHIGVIDELQSRGYSITSVTGSSMGALVGGLFAAGKLEGFKNWIVDLDKLDVLSLIDFTVTTKGFVKGEKVFDRMRKLNLIPEVNIEDLSIPYVAVAVDILSNREVVFSEGSLTRAIRSSISIPSVFTPVTYNGNVLVDGGVLNPLPLVYAKRNPDDILVAVDLNSLIPYENPNFKLVSAKKTIKSNEKVAALISKWDELFGHQPQQKKQDDEKLSKSKIGYFDLVMRSVHLMQTKLTDYSIALNPPDVLIPISNTASTIFEFYKAEELITYGRYMCAKILDEKGL